MSISFFHLTLTSHCDVISDVINIKSTSLGLISGGLSISDVKMNLSKIFEIFKKAAILRPGRTFKPEVVPEVESYIKIGHAIVYVLTFCSTFQLQY